jgi:hypothetical protein
VFSTVIYAVSYGMISQSLWLSNITPIIAYSNIFLFLLSRQTEGRSKSGIVFLTSFLVGVIGQHSGAVGTFLFPFLLWFYRRKLNITNLALIFGGFLLPALPLAIFQFRHNFITLKAFLSFAAGSEGGVGFSIGIFWNNLKILFGQINAAVSFPIMFASSLLFLLGIIRLWKNQNRNLIYAYFLLPFFFLGLFQRVAIGFFFHAALTLAIAVCIYGLWQFPKVISYTLLAIILGLNIANLPLIYKPTNALIPIGDANVITLQDRKNIIDWMYSKAQGKKFAIWYYTIPFYQEEAWDYLFLTYAEPKYGYLPEATHGFSPNDLKTAEYFFAVYEPEYDSSRIPVQTAWFNEVARNFGESVDTYRSHGITADLTSWQPN